MQGNIKTTSCSRCGERVLVGSVGYGLLRHRVQLDAAPIAHTAGPLDTEYRAHADGRRTYLVALGVAVVREVAGKMSAIPGPVHVAHECTALGIAAHRRGIRGAR